MSELGSESRPLRVAVIGAGPSGFYVAEALFKSDAQVVLDLYDRLPTPYGLLRGGVAPDHQKMKSVAKAYERVATKNENFTFWGNVTIGKDISVEELHQYYDAIVFSCGCESSKNLGIPGEDLPGSYAATEFVGWYNGHPDYRDCHFDLSTESVVIIGQGNVAVDVARILAKTPEELGVSDIAAHAEDALRNSNVKEIHMIGRRGPAQVAFTQMEIGEMGELDDAGVEVNPEHLAISESSQAELEDASMNKTRKSFEVLREIAQKEYVGKSKKVLIRFFETPIEILGDDAVTGIRVQKNHMEGEPFAQKVSATGDEEIIPCGLVFRSIGYRGLPMPGVPFDDRKGVFRNSDGRIVDESDSPVSGEYVAGWIKRGPTGVIGTNKPDSAATVEKMLEDLSKLTPCPQPDSSKVEALLKDRGVRYVRFKEWQQIDAAEVANGEKIGKPREKFTRIEDMLAVIDG